MAKFVFGGKYWDDRDRSYFIQTNNPSEEILRKAGELNHYLESCGPTAALSCLASLGRNVSITTPGGYEPQPEEVLMDFFNDSRFYPDLLRIRNDRDIQNLPFNRVPQFYPFAVQQVFGDTTGKFVPFPPLAELVSHLEMGGVFQACLINPGHYLAFVAYDKDSGEFIYNDSWPNRHPDKDGFNKRMNHVEFIKEVQPYAILYG